MARLILEDLEHAINHWRERAPSPDGVSLSPPVEALAEVYVRMARGGAGPVDESELTGAARQAWLAWYATTADTPCIAICSTSQGDEVCKGCGRSVDEVRQWPAMSPAEKRVVWHRITRQASAWRFNRYAERAREQGAP